MAVVIETTIGDLTVDLFVKERPLACLNFLKLCKLKYYNYNLFHTIEHGFIAQTGDPTGTTNGGESIWGVVEGVDKRYFEAESMPKIRHSEPGLLSLVSTGDNMVGSQFFFTLGADITSLDGVHCVIGELVEGEEVLAKLNETICDEGHRPYQDIRITHTVILEDPFENPRGFREPSRSPSPDPHRMQGGRIGADEDLNDTEGKTDIEVREIVQEREAKARATILEIVGDLPDADIAPPENVLFVCKLNPVTTDDDLEIIFSRFGTVVGCEVIRDHVSGDSLQYAFIEFSEKKACEDAFFKMDNVLIDDRRIHVDFSQSVSKMQWRGKGKGIIHYDEKTGKPKARNGGRKPTPELHGPKRERRDTNRSPPPPPTSQRNRSPRRRGSPERRQRSPPRRDFRRKSPVFHQRRDMQRPYQSHNRDRNRRSPDRRNRMPDRRERSPRGRAKSPLKRLRSPERRKRSRTPEKRAAKPPVTRKANQTDKRNRSPAEKRSKQPSRRARSRSRSSSSSGSSSSSDDNRRSKRKPKKDIKKKSKNSKAPASSSTSQSSSSSSSDSEDERKRVDKKKSHRK